MESSEQDYWVSLIQHIREVQKWSQSRLAEELGTNQETISRWEIGAANPSSKKQELLEKLAERLHLSSLGGIASIVRISPFPMLLCNRHDEVVAASASSGFKEGLGVLEQTPQEQHRCFREFSSMIRTGGFWNRSGQTFEYNYVNGDGERFGAVVTSVGIRGEIYCVVQATAPARGSP